MKKKLTKLKEKYRRVKHESEEKDHTIKVYQEDQERSKKQLEILKGGNSTDLKAHISTLELENEQKIKEIDKLETEVKYLQKKVQNLEEQREQSVHSALKLSHKNSDDVDILKQINEEKNLIEKNVSFFLVHNLM